MNKKRIDPRIKRTKKYFRDALIELLVEKDVSSITVQEITEKAELTRGTFYLHYLDKQDFLTKTMNEMLMDLIEYVKPTENSDTNIVKSEKNNTPVSFINLFKFISDNAVFFKVMFSDKGIPQFRSHMTNIVQTKVYGELIDSIVDLEGKLTIPKEILISYISAAHIGVICSWLEGGMIYSPIYMAEQLTRLTLNGPIHVAGLEGLIRLPY